MATKIEKKITGYSVVSKDEPVSAPAPQVQEKPVAKLIDRPERLIGNTYKVKPPIDGVAAMYITINDIILDEGLPTERRHPFEIFINSKTMDHYQWIVALTRVLSAVFRLGGDIEFLVEELSSVFDPKGGYWKRGGKFMPSLVAEIGFVLNEHMKSIGIIKDEVLSEHAMAIIHEKKAQYLAANSAPQNPAGTIPGAMLCGKCGETAVIKLDGCLICTSCGDSKCS